MTDRPSAMALATPDDTWMLPRSYEILPPGAVENRSTARPLFGLVSPLLVSDTTIGP